MGFFDDLRLPKIDLDEDDDHSMPEWFEPPEGFVAGVVPVELVLARNDEAAVFLTRIAAYPAGFQFDAELITRKYMRRDDAFDLMYDPDRPQGEIPPELVRIGIAFSDGRRTSSFGEMVSGASTRITAMSADEEEPLDPATEIRMEAQGGGGGARHATQTYWVWPLPPDGPVVFVCEWPAYGIEETAIEVDGALIRHASDRSKSVWGESGT